METTREILNAETGEVRILPVFNGGVTDDQLKSWKEAHRKVYAIEVEDDNELFVAYFKRPTMETMSAVNKLSKSDEIKGTATLFDNCWLGGDPLVKSDTLLRMAAIKQLGVMFDKVLGTLKNL
ncbi:MAG: hypothetical protein RR383_08935 [Muribaculaceae bacterium]